MPTDGPGGFAYRRACVRSGLPQPDRGTRRIFDDRHAAFFDVSRLHDDLAAGGARLFHGCGDVRDRNVWKPQRGDLGRALIFGHPVEHAHLLAFNAHHCIVEAGSHWKILRRPAEDGPIELLGTREVRRSKVGPAHFTRPVFPDDLHAKNLLELPETKTDSKKNAQLFSERASARVLYGIAVRRCYFVFSAVKMPDAPSGTSVSVHVPRMIPSDPSVPLNVAFTLGTPRSCFATPSQCHTMVLPSTAPSADPR